MMPESHRDRRARVFVQEHIEPIAGEHFASGDYPLEVVKAARDERLVA